MARNRKKVQRKKAKQYNAISDLVDALNRLEGLKRKDALVNAIAAAYGVRGGVDCSDCSDCGDCSDCSDCDDS